MIYFIQNGDTVKIGYAANPDQRVASLRSSSPHVIRVLGVMEGSPGDERALHQMFAQHRIRREWFKWCGDIQDYIANMALPYRERMDGRRQRNMGRTAQMGQKVRPEIRDRFVQACAARQITQTAALEQALLAWANGA